LIFESLVEIQYIESRTCAALKVGDEDFQLGRQSGPENMTCTAPDTYVVGTSSLFDL
jgi:hypothetical protein